MVTGMNQKQLETQIIRDEHISEPDTAVISRAVKTSCPFRA